MCKFVLVCRYAKRLLDFVSDNSQIFSIYFTAKILQHCTLYVYGIELVNVIAMTLSWNSYNVLHMWPNLHKCLGCCQLCSFKTGLARTCKVNLPYLCHHNLLWIMNHSWILNAEFYEPLLSIFFFKKWEEKILIVSYNGTSMVSIPSRVQYYQHYKLKEICSSFSPSASLRKWKRQLQMLKKGAKVIEL